MEPLGVRILGCTVDREIDQSRNSIIYRARRDADGTEVVLKVLKESYPSPERVAWFRNEFDMLGELDFGGVVDGYDFGLEGDRWVMVLEDFGGDSVERVVAEERFTIREALHVGRQVAGILAGVHERGIVHKDINPTNIVLNRQTGVLKLIDFGISTRLLGERAAPASPDVLEGTLHYISPEQTGRMNHSVDERTDLYSLGVTLYELLTGKRPFIADDAIELVHAHLARSPRNPLELNARVPPVAADIVLKLMSKDPADRYQSAESLALDLQECIDAIDRDEEIAPFALGRRQQAARFAIPEKLYGREEETRRLLRAFDGAASGGVELMLVAGYSGVGKTSLVAEVHKPVAGHRGFFVTGKFDQLQRDVPYAAVLQALRGLLRQLLTAPEQQLDVWRAKMQDALSPNAQVVIDVLPELALIIGPRPAAP